MLSKKWVERLNVRKQTVDSSSESALPTSSTGTGSFFKSSKCKIVLRVFSYSEVKNWYKIIAYIQTNVSPSN